MRRTVKIGHPYGNDKVDVTFNPDGSYYVASHLDGRLYDPNTDFFVYVKADGKLTGKDTRKHRKRILEALNVFKAGR